MHFIQSSLLAIAITLIAAIPTNAQHNECACETFLSLSYYQAKDVFATHNGDMSMYSLKNDSLQEDFIHFIVVGQHKNMLKVVPGSINNTYDTGWISNNNVSVFGTNYSHPLHIYQQHDYKSEKVITLYPTTEPEYHVIGCNGKWLQVQLTINDISISGWLSPDDQCGSAYTTCN